MKIRISDMMDHLEAPPREVQAPPVSAQRIREAALERVRRDRRGGRLVGRLSKTGILVAALIALFSVSAIAAAVVLHWDGFALTGDLSGAEKEALLEAATATSVESVDREGNVHYYDDDGREILVLSAEEAAAREQERQQAHDRAVMESTDLVDLSAMPFLPNRVAEVATDASGAFPEFALSNASMVLLYPEGSEGYDLQAGDRVTVSLDDQEACYLSFSLFRDGQYLEDSQETVQAQFHSHTFTIEADGRYCIALEYLSAGTGFFTSGLVTIH